MRILHLLTSLNSELIDTLWNVNSQRADLKLNQMIELIDTLWNVNTRGKMPLGHA